VINGVANANYTLPAGTKAGSYTISAAYSGTSALAASTDSSQSLTVNISLVSISLTPVNSTIGGGTTEEFTATGLYSDNSTQNLTNLVTWSSSAPSVATISNTVGSQGLAKALAAGSTTIQASLGPVSATTLLTATAAPQTLHATGVASVTHSRKGLTNITVAFDEALNPVFANNSHLYAALGGVRKRGTIQFIKRLTIAGVTYNDSNHTVNVKLLKPYKGRVQLTVHGGVVAANGAMTSGDSSMSAS
jgi:hypothetical protein